MTRERPQAHASSDGSESAVGNPLFAWPDAAQRKRLLWSLFGLSLLFVIVYGGADYITSIRSTRFPVHFDFERTLPFVPELSVVYSSVYFMFAFIALAMQTEDQLRRFVGRMALVTLVAGLAFLLYPSELVFENREVTGWASVPFWWADLINLTYNCVPSLHVTYAVLCAETMRRKRWWAGVVFHAWAFAIASAAWLTYQHHLADLVTGYLLGSIAALPSVGRLDEFFAAQEE